MTLKFVKKMSSIVTRLVLLVSTASLFAACTQMPFQRSSTQDPALEVVEIVDGEQSGTTSMADRKDARPNSGAEDLTFEMMNLQLMTLSRLLDTTATKLEDVEKSVEETQIQIGMISSPRQTQNLSSADGSVKIPVCKPQKLASVALNSETLINGRVIVGSREWVYLMPPGEHFKARVDTGATTSSLSAENIVHFERNGKPWVRFIMSHEKIEVPIELEAPLVRVAKVKQASNGESDHREVVQLSLRLGSIKQKVQFTLTSRNDMRYPVLLGRSFLRDVALVDVGKYYVHPKYRPAAKNAEQTP